MLQGRGVEAIKLAEEAIKQSNQRASPSLPARVLIFAGKPERGDALATELDQKLDQALAGIWKLLAGEADLKRGAARAAVDNFNAAQKILDTWLGRDALGRAYLAANVLPDAQTEFDVCLRERVRRRRYCSTTSRRIGCWRPRATTWGACRKDRAALPQGPL